MAYDLMNGWDQRCLAVEEATFNTTPNPAGAQALEVVNLDMGQVEQAFTRAKKDKTQGRGVTAGFVAGRVQPIPFSLETSVKSRTAIDTTPKEDPIYVGAGLLKTTNTSTSVVYNVTSVPSPVGLSLYSILGTGAGSQHAQQGFGGCVEQLEFSGGDTELMLKASGKFAGKHHLGQAVATVADDSTTTVSVGTAAHIYRLGIGWYTWGSEIIKITAVNYSGGSFTCSRGALSSTPAAHSAVALYPYVPTLTLMGSPISEANCTVTLDSLSTVCTKFNIVIETGISHRPGETGSSRSQGLKVGRVTVKPTIELLLDQGQSVLLGKVTQRKQPLALTIVCGTGTGSIVTFSMPYCEVRPFNVPAPSNDVAVVSVPLDCRDDSGSDLWSMTLT